MRRRSTSGTLFTIGYEGLSPGDLVKTLRHNGVELVLDVRQRASSRKAGFSKSVLKSNLEKHGISYQHFPELGSPPDLRKKYNADGDRAYFIRHYRNSLEGKGSILQELANLASTMPVALVCYEADPGHCHRSIVASEMARLSTPALQVQDL
ncbi:MAG: DUF488 domain-containing protein [Actinobacteria bacterium]|nr:DUF488 domain-containing protein [Actinomycetota bacterium]MBU2689156.1 DUF488 domain-containing protein [Actinomycetota bacterium]